jgi:diaminopimelate decarboxylase
VEEGILSLNINHPEEIERFRSIAKKLSKTVNIGVRITFDDGWTGQLGVPEAHAMQVFANALEDTRVQRCIAALPSRRTIQDKNDLDGHLANVLGFVGLLQTELGFHSTDSRCRR